MARRYLMSWKSSEARWRKMHKGQWYGISCRELGVAPTKEASWRAANEWWINEAKRISKPIEADPDTRALLIKTLEDWHPDVSESARAKLVDEIVGEGEFAKLEGVAISLVEASSKLPTERAISIHVEAWRQLIHGLCQAGQLSAARYDSYCRDIATFARWIGESMPIEAINEEKVEEFFKHLSSMVGSGTMSPPYAHGVLMTARQFIDRLVENKLISVPGNLRSRRFRFNQGRAKKIETFTVDEIRAMLATCEGWSERTQLYILLGLNIGAYQGDIAEITHDEIDWKAKTITRVRSKMRERDGLIVTYRLWDETMALLKKHRSSQGPLVLTTEEGNRLSRRWLEGDKVRRYDLIHSAWMRMAKKMGMRKNRLGFKHLRKTASSILGTHPQYKYFCSYFLAHAPRGVTDRSYVKPSDPEFFESIDWLRDQILGPKPG